MMSLDEVLAQSEAIVRGYVDTHPAAGANPV
jgi:hypothetical protein